VGCLNRSGDRQLNCALHLIAVCQIRDPSPGQVYYRRKLDQAKTPEEARRSLKRQLSNVIHAISSPITDVEPPRVDTQRRCQVTFARLVVAWTMTAARADNSRQRHQASENSGQTRAAATARIIAVKTSTAVP
jgi:hypothetical protein